MKVFDFNIHLPLVRDEDVNKVIADDLSLELSSLVKAFDSHLPTISKNEGANFMLFNPQLFKSETSFSLFDQKVRKVFSSYSYTALVDFRQADIMTYLELVKSSRVNFIMFNSYLQKIEESDFNKVLLACKFAEENNIGLCIDGSYGTSKMYAYDNMKLACYVADHITKVPIVIIHSGGKRVLEAMLLAADKKNVFLDTSFSLPYYIGSSVEKDMAFAYKSIGSGRVLYGSDFPYMNSTESEKIHMDFFERHKFSSPDIENIMCTTAHKLIRRNA